MLSNAVQDCLSALSLSTPEMGYSGGGAPSSLTQTARVSAALGFLSKRDKLAASLLKAVYTQDPSDIRAAAFDLLPRLSSCKKRSHYLDLIEQLMRGCGYGDRGDCLPQIPQVQIQVSIGVVLIQDLIGSLGGRRCGYCKGFRKDCQHCDGTGIVQAKPMGERRLLSSFDLEGLTRHHWRTHCAPHYHVLSGWLAGEAGSSSSLFLKLMRSDSTDD